MSIWALIVVTGFLFKRSSIGRQKASEKLFLYFVFFTQNPPKYQVVLCTYAYNVQVDPQVFP